MAMSPLEDVLRARIAQDGPISVGEFMDLALSHPQHGYYASRDPFGRSGDFTTAPEVSQMFGEITGAWVADCWTRMGAPPAFTLLECGPGRGTLMRDMLRATRSVPGFHDAANIMLMEISPVLKILQRENLPGVDVAWAGSVSGCPDGRPLIVIGNEFLDALPFTQLHKKDGQWWERVVDFGEVFVFSSRPAGPDLVAHVPEELLQAEEGSVFEFSQAREKFIAEISRSVSRNGGAALFCDYGYAQTALGESFQALKAHRPVDVLSHIGEADLTSHVDFCALKNAALREGVNVLGPVEQGAFLKALGIDARAERLMRGQSSDVVEGIKKDLHRLTDSSEMGALFKVLCLAGRDENSIVPAGF
jgi:NADH dehydrogenase [ubiquinone] 1 alpha subcomplex assembly factor 7